MGSFELSLQKFAKATPEKVTQVARKIGGEVLAKVVFRSPVGNPKLWKSKPPAGYVGGRFRSNWNIGLGDFGTDTSEAIDGAGQTISKGSAKLQGLQPGQTFYLTNSLPYAIRLEYGHSQEQAPKGMVRLTVAEFQPIVNKIVRALR